MTRADTESRPPGWPGGHAPFHDGERAVQARAGVRERIAQTGHRGIRDFMPDQHRELFGKLPFLLAGGLDARRRPWASLLVGHPGFVSTPDARTMRIDARPGHGDPLAAGLATGAKIGLLGIQPETRRRNRANGTVIAGDARGITVHVEQSFGNCPKYIQARAPELIAEPSVVHAPRPFHREGAALSAESAAIAARADTFFIATASAGTGSDDAAEGVDVSHRGGRPGFVRVTREGAGTVLTVPDFAGNAYFNTFGNIASDPRAGFLFIDFASGDVLSLTGHAEIVWDGPELASFTAAQRLLRFAVEEGVRIANAVPLRWSAAQFAPQLAATGSWDAP